LSAPMLAPLYVELRASMEGSGPDDLIEILE
jgi:hypothetical protein